MEYPLYLSMGVPIATGFIEGACRHLICDRMDITGARWRLDRAEAVLRLRSILASGDFDEYWQFHEAEEWRRNRISKYAGDLVPSSQTHDYAISGSSGPRRTKEPHPQQQGADPLRRRSEAGISA